MRRLVAMEVTTGIQKIIRVVIGLSYSVQTKIHTRNTAMHKNTNNPSRMVTQAMLDLPPTARSRLRYANHRRMACDVNVPTTNTRIVFGIWVIAQLESYDVVGMVDTADAIVVTNSITTANVPKLLLNVRFPYSP
jgi:hypothetical protein